MCAFRTCYPCQMNSFTGNIHSGASTEMKSHFSLTPLAITRYRQIRLSPQWTLLESLK